jgi:glutathione S-transferase
MVWRGLIFFDGLRSNPASNPSAARAFSLNFRYEPREADERERKRVADNKGQLKIWGRANSVNVQKVLWCLAELDLAHERIDAGMAFGRNTEPDYLAMNPNARVPTLVDGDYVLWESNSVMRYLAMSYRPESPLYPQAPKLRAGVDRWLDWTLSTVQPFDRPVFWGLVRPSAGQREGDAFTLADIAIGAFARRWLGFEGVSKPKLAHLERWYAQISERPGFQQFVAPPMS